MRQKPPIQMIAVDQINILNPRARNQRIFTNITDNILQVGLKRPITVRAASSAEGKRYDLVCGQGRLEAFIACGKAQIPAVVIDATEEQALIMSLVENHARRHYRAIDLLQGIEILQKQGYGIKEIAAKTGLGHDYTKGLMQLLKQGEERLLTAVEAGKMPISIAVQIMEAEGGKAVQQALQDAYDNHQLRGRRFMEARRLVELRRHCGKTITSSKRADSSEKKVSGQDIVKAYQREVDRKKLLTRKAEYASITLIFVVESLRMLLREKGFQSVLATEGLSTLPKPISELIKLKAAT
ncbi:MAG TPA: ParB N-terminal domain-containing protein [Rickettsiales bacterium]|nr:ParB N-terminal domain-containing protein [Rickettsiales bacterium]